MGFRRRPHQENIANKRQRIISPTCSSQHGHHAHRSCTLSMSTAASPTLKSILPSLSSSQLKLKREEEEEEEEEEEVEVEEAAEAQEEEKYELLEEDSCISNILTPTDILQARNAQVMELNEVDVKEKEHPEEEEAQLATESISMLLSSTTDEGFALHHSQTFLHSSGRLTLEQEALSGMKRATIESEFEQYFAAILFL